MKAVALGDPVFYRDFKYHISTGQYRLVDLLPAYTGDDAAVFVPFLTREMGKAIEESGLPVVRETDTPYQIKFYVVAPPYFMGNTWVALLVRVIRRDSLAVDHLVAESVFAYSPGLLGTRDGIWGKKAIKRVAEALVNELKAGKAEAGQRAYILVPPGDNGAAPAAAPKPH